MPKSLALASISISQMLEIQDIIYKFQSLQIRENFPEENFKVVKADTLKFDSNRGEWDITATEDTSILAKEMVENNRVNYSTLLLTLNIYLMGKEGKVSTYSIYYNWNETEGEKWFVHAGKETVTNVNGTTGSRNKYWYLDLDDFYKSNEKLKEAITQGVKEYKKFKSALETIKGSRVVQGGKKDDSETCSNLLKQYVQEGITIGEMKDRLLTVYNENFVNKVIVDFIKDEIVEVDTRV